VDALGLLTKTYFLVTSDHGYNLGHHRLPSNKFLLYDHSLRIPMVFKGPGIVAGSNLEFYGA
jgi:arylsulfatase A-like enzyme